MAPKAPAKGAPAKSPKAAAPPKDEKGKGADAPPEPTASVPTATTAPKNKEEVLAQVNLDGLPHCPNDQILEILREKYETLVAVFIHYCKQSECKTLEQATRLRLGAPCRHERSRMFRARRAANQRQATPAHEGRRRRAP